MADVTAYLKSGASAPAPAGLTSAATIPAQALTTYEDLPVTQIRKVIADRLTYSKQNIPHYYVSVDCEVDRMLELRAKLNVHSSSKISVNDMIIKASSLACLQAPETNSSW